MPPDTGPQELPPEDRTAPSSPKVTKRFLGFIPLDATEEELEKIVEEIKTIAQEPEDDS